MKKFVYTSLLAALVLAAGGLLSCKGGYTDPSYKDYHEVYGGGGSGSGGGNSGGGNTTTDLNYSATTDDIVLVFRDSPRAAIRSGSYRASIGDAEGSARAALTTGSFYEIYYHGDLVSNGTISVTGSTITFTCTVTYGTFTATINGDDISFAGTVALNDGSTQSFSGNFSKQNQSGANPFIGTWHESTYGGAVVVQSSTWEYSDGWWSHFSGTYTYIGNTATYYFSGNSYPNVTTIINGAFHTQGLRFSK
jgi:hypothetical protein